MNARHPLLERLRFLSISASNLDEFYMVRAAGIYGQIANDVTKLSQDGLTPTQQITAISAFASVLVDEKIQCWRARVSELAEAGISITEPNALPDEDRVWLDDMFMSHVFQVLTPIAADPAHPFPFILNKGLTLVVALEPAKPDGKPMTGLIPIPASLQRFIRLRDLPGEPATARFIPIEAAIATYAEALFPGFKVKAHGAFRVLRDSDVQLEEEAEDLVATFEELFTRRRRCLVIRLERDASMS